MAFIQLGLIPVLAAIAISPPKHRKPSLYELEVQKEAREIVSIKPNPYYSKKDADKIFWFYFVHNISGCGFPSDSTEEGDFWVSTPHIGYTGEPSKHPMRLHKSTGRISWESGPTYDSILALTQAAIKKQ